MWCFHSEKFKIEYTRIQNKVCAFCTKQHKYKPDTTVDINDIGIGQVDSNKFLAEILDSNLN